MVREVHEELSPGEATPCCCVRGLGGIFPWGCRSSRNKVEHTKTDHNPHSLHRLSTVRVMPSELCPWRMEGWGKDIFKIQLYLSLPYSVLTVCIWWCCVHEINLVPRSWVCVWPVTVIGDYALPILCDDPWAFCCRFLLPYHTGGEIGVSMRCSWFSRLKPLQKMIIF